MRMHPVFHSSLLKKFVSSTVSGRSQSTPAPVVVDGEPKWEVEDIVGIRKVGRGRQFLVKWKGFPDHENSWVKGKDLHAPDILADFWARQSRGY